MEFNTGALVTLAVFVAGNFIFMLVRGGYIVRQLEDLEKRMPDKSAIMERLKADSATMQQHMEDDRRAFDKMDARMDDLHERIAEIPDVMMKRMREAGIFEPKK